MATINSWNKNIVECAVNIIQIRSFVFWFGIGQGRSKSIHEKQNFRPLGTTVEHFLSKTNFFLFFTSFLFLFSFRSSESIALLSLARLLLGNRHHHLHQQQWLWSLDFKLPLYSWSFPNAVGFKLGYYITKWNVFGLLKFSSGVYIRVLRL